MTGIGLGNIFSDGPVKLKPTGRSETKDEVRTEPISEPRKDLPPDSKVLNIYWINNDRGYLPCL